MRNLAAHESPFPSFVDGSTCRVPPARHDTSGRDSFEGARNMPNGNKTKPTKPTDRQPKKAKAVRTDDGFVVTIRGIEVTVLLDALNDWELLDALAELDEDRPESASVLPSLLRRALGPGDNKRVMNLLRDPSTGRVPLDAGVRFVAELFGAINPNG